MAEKMDVLHRACEHALRHFGQIERLFQKLNECGFGIDISGLAVTVKAMQKALAETDKDKPPVLPEVTDHPPCPHCKTPVGFVMLGAIHEYYTRKQAALLDVCNRILDRVSPVIVTTSPPQRYLIISERFMTDIKDAVEEAEKHG